MLIQKVGDYKRSSLFCFTETWLREDINITLDGYTIIRADRNKETTGKKVGGGLCMLVNNNMGN